MGNSASQLDPTNSGRVYAKSPQVGGQFFRKNKVTKLWLMNEHQVSKTSSRSGTMDGGDVILRRVKYNPLNSSLKNLEPDEPTLGKNIADDHFDATDFNTISH